ncbi:MAG: hypothetical protein ACQKBY_08660, partial [Verrucomicrobiales bacterium]
MKKMSTKFTPLACLVALAPALPGATLGTVYSNGTQADWTVTAENGIEIGLRAKRRYPSGSNDVGQFNDTGIYTFDVLNDYATEFATTPANRSFWNFDFSVNVNPDGTGSSNLADFTYMIRIDSDPTEAT